MGGREREEGKERREEQETTKYVHVHCYLVFSANTIGLVAAELVEETKTDVQPGPSKQHVEALPVDQAPLPDAEGKAEVCRIAAPNTLALLNAVAPSLENTSRIDSLSLKRCLRLVCVPYATQKKYPSLSAYYVTR